jgi:uncharacterized protein involved in exopolysaccharide biosynthesis
VDAAATTADPVTHPGPGLRRDIESLRQQLADLNKELGERADELEAES